MGGATLTSPGMKLHPGPGTVWEVIGQHTYAVPTVPIDGRLGAGMVEHAKIRRREASNYIAVAFVACRVKQGVHIEFGMSNRWHRRHGVVNERRGGEGGGKGEDTASPHLRHNSSPLTRYISRFSLHQHFTRAHE